MNLRPVFYFIAGFLLCLLWQKCGGKDRPSYILKEDIVTVEKRDTIRYPEHIEIPKYITKKITETVYLNDQAQIDSLIAVYEAEINKEKSRSQKLLDQLYAANAGDHLIKDDELKTYADTIEKESYRLSWEIGVLENKLNHFNHDVTVFNTEKTITQSYRNSFGMVFGAVTPWSKVPLIPGSPPTGMSADAVLGVSYERDWVNMQLSIMPNNEAVMLQVNPKIKW